MDPALAEGACSMSEEPPASANPTAIDSHEVGDEQAEDGSFALVEVVSPLTGVAICSVQARSVPELKARIQKATGIHSFGQRLIFDSHELEDGRATLPAAGRGPIVVGLLQRAPIVGVVERAVEKLSDDDSIEFADLLEALDKELADLCVPEGHDMEQAACLLVEKALFEPDLAIAEGCAAIACTLHKRYAERFSGEFLNTCQAEFEKFPLTLTGIGAAERERTKTRMLAMVMFIGYLFIWKMLPRTVVAKVIRDFMGNVDKGDQNPEEHFVWCTCELLDIAGYHLDHTPKGKALVTHGLDQLSDLMQKSNTTSREPVYSEALKEHVQRVIKLRSNDWQY